MTAAPDFERALAGAPSPREGLFGPRSMLWRLCRERALVLFAPRVVLLQYAHPSFAAASEAYSLHDRSPGARFGRAVRALLAIVFGNTDTALSHARRVARVHSRLHGENGARTWSATDPDALRWVLLTLLDGALRGGELVTGALSRHETRTFFDEAARLGLLFGVNDGVPTDRGSLDSAIAAHFSKGFEGSSELREIWRFVAGDAAFRARWIASAIPIELATWLGVAHLQSRAMTGLGIAAGRSARLLPARFRFVPPYLEARARIR